MARCRSFGLPDLSRDTVGAQALGVLQAGNDLEHLGKCVGQ